VITRKYTPFRLLTPFCRNLRKTGLTDLRRTRRFRAKADQG